MTTTKQMQRFAISLIKAIETQKQKDIVKVNFNSSSVFVFFHKELNSNFIPIWKSSKIRENTKVFKEALQAIKDIR
jgi:hypothetical protein